ncbi:MAG: glutathione S-transferase N-terminal domain-containing protein [Burkholderiaceae bacterium]
MLRLHYYPGNASLTPHVLLEELGVPYEPVLVDRTRDAHKSPEYLRLNPNGQIPVLVDGELVLYETAAICMHLADTHPGPGSRRRSARPGARTSTSGWRGARTRCRPC